MPSGRPLRLAPGVQKTLRSLPPQVKQRLRAAIDQLRRQPERGKALRGELSGWQSWRAGRMRIIYRTHRKAIEVAAIGPRASIYLEVARGLYHTSE